MYVRMCVCMGHHRGEHGVALEDGRKESVVRVEHLVCTHEVAVAVDDRRGPEPVNKLGQATVTV